MDQEYDITYEEIYPEKTNLLDNNNKNNSIICRLLRYCCCFIL